MNLLQKSIDNFQEMPDVSDLFKKLISVGIKIGIGSGLPRSFMDLLIDHLGWDEEVFDFICSSEELDHGRPHPIMIQEGMKQLRVSDNNKGFESWRYINGCSGRQKC